MNQIRLSFKLLCLLVLNHQTAYADNFELGKQAYLEKNYSDSIKYWSEPDLLDNAEVQFSLGVLHMNGMGVEKNMKAGVQYYSKSAQLGHVSAQYNLGLAYYLGTGVDINLKRTITHWRKAAKSQHQTAQYNLASLLWNGNDRNRFQSHRESIYWFRKAIENGSDDARSFLNSLYDPMASDLLNSGKWMVPDETGNTVTLSAFQLAKRAAQAKDYDQAKELWFALAEEGDFNAQYEIGRLYELGTGVDQSMAKALSWYQKAANKGQADAQFRLGLYHHGEGENANPGLAMYWLQSASDNGHAEAQKILDESR